MICRLTAMSSKCKGLRFLTRHFVAGCSITFEADPAFPQLVRCADATLGWGINNPDCNYAFAALDGTATYRLIGNLGMARHIDLQLHEANFCEAPNFRVVGSAKRKDVSRTPASRTRSIQRATTGAQ